jgi:hypothetical protein
MPPVFVARKQPADAWTQRTGKAIERYHAFSGFTQVALKFK